MGEVWIREEVGEIQAVRGKVGVVQHVYNHRGQEGK